MTTEIGIPGFEIEIELQYQSIGYRWAHNLDAYASPEPKRFVEYFTATAASSSAVVARTTTRIQ